jgi:hypothetical protein
MLDGRALIMITSGSFRCMPVDGNSVPMNKDLGHHVWNISHALKDAAGGFRKPSRRRTNATIDIPLDEQMSVYLVSS